MALILTAAACERDEEILGPSLNDLYGDFQTLEDFKASRQSVDFSADQSVLFSARFSKTVDWEVHIIGKTSGATKIISDKSNLIDNTNGVWNGTTTLLPMFKAEECMAVLKVEEENFFDTIPLIQIDSIRSVEGYLLADFENGVNPGWTIFAQSGGNMSFKIVQSDSSAQGSHFYDMGGEVDFDYLIGLIDMPASAYGEDRFPLNSNPNNVYFNVFLDKPAGINNEIVLFQFREDENEDGVYQAASEDMYSIELRGLETNWQSVSIKYADMIALVNGAPATPAGNGVHEPHKLLQLSVLFLADPSSGYSQTLMDNIIFTENGPIEP